MSYQISWAKKSASGRFLGQFGPDIRSKINSIFTKKIEAFRVKICLEKLYLSLIFYFFSIILKSLKVRINLNMSVESNFNLNNIVNRNKFGWRIELSPFSFQVELPTVQIYLFLSSSWLSLLSSLFSLNYLFYVNRNQYLLNRKLYWITSLMESDSIIA